MGYPARDLIECILLHYGIPKDDLLVDDLCKCMRDAMNYAHDVIIAHEKEKEKNNG